MHSHLNVSYVEGYDVYWIHLVQGEGKWRWLYVVGKECSGSLKCWLCL